MFTHVMLDCDNQSTVKYSHKVSNSVEEYGLYYLQSRYYNPETGRFLNADALASTGQGLLGNNMFAYCNNNPINYVDQAGSRCVAIKPLGGGAIDNPVSSQEELSTAEKITILMFETASAVADGLDAEVAVGMGFGGTIGATIFGVNAGVDLFATSKIALVIDDGMIDLMSITSYSAGLSVLDLDYLGVGVSNGVSHSFFDPECTCHINSSFYDMSVCKANKPFYDHSASIGASAGGYIVVGGEAAIGYDFKTFADHAMSAYESLF